MRLLKVQDPRRVLTDTKYYVQRPRPLLDYVRKLPLSRCAEHVFWIHWDAGALCGDGTSEIPVSELALRVGCNASSVVRAHQQLQKMGLLRRQDAGRDPFNPLRQATSITEVLLPGNAIPSLLNAPSRQRRTDRAPACEIRAPQPESPSERPLAPVPEIAVPSPVDGTQEATAPASGADHIREVIHARYGKRKAMDQILAKLSAEEKHRYFEASRSTQTSSVTFEFASDTGLDADEKAYLRGVLGSYASTATQSPTTQGPTSNRSNKGVTSPERLSLFELARLRKGICSFAKGAALEELLRQVAWDMQHGWLARQERNRAIHTGIKLVREGRWTRPNRMPPNWCIAA